MALFTLIAEYDGGTYIQQVIAPSPRAVLQELPKRDTTLPENVVAAIGQLESDVDKPISIRGTKNVWCLTTTYKRQLLLLNIVKTAS